MTTQKLYATGFDEAADRAEMMGAVPATSKQCWFLAKLFVDAGHDPQDYGLSIIHHNATLTKKKASNLISTFLDAQK